MMKYQKLHQHSVEESKRIDCTPDKEIDVENLDNQWDPPEQKQSNEELNNVKSLKIIDYQKGITSSYVDL